MKNTESIDVPTIAALLPRDTDGHQFVCYSDCCSGIPDTENERTFAQVNAVLRRLQPQPEFICFPGDEIRGLNLDEQVLRQQWRYWLEIEMGWLDQNRTPLYHTTGNHTAYDALSQGIFRQMLPHLPHNGLADQRGLSYFVHRDNLLLIFVNTLNANLGGEGYVETEWLEHIMVENQDAKHKLVFGHHPVFPVNGYSGPYQRQIGPICAEAFWDILVRYGVIAYFCSHMLAFDVQVHQGVLQIMTAGAGTSPLMPANCEYHHLVQAAIDDAGLRYQTIDKVGHIRERLCWPPVVPSLNDWKVLPAGDFAARCPKKPPFITWRFTGRLGYDNKGQPQTLLSCWDEGTSPSMIWMGCRGMDQRIAVLMRHTPGRSPHLWLGPSLSAGGVFDLQVALHPGMGPGGVLFRATGEDRWSSLKAASPWGSERLAWPAYWSVGHDRNDPLSQPFRGTDLKVSWSGHSPN